MRCSLYLQQYIVHVLYIKGSDNIGSDYLSRMEMLCSDTLEANLESDCPGNVLSARVPVLSISIYIMLIELLLSYMDCLIKITHVSS